MRTDADFCPGTLVLIRARHGVIAVDTVHTVHTAHTHTKQLGHFENWDFTDSSSSANQIISRTQTLNHGTPTPTIWALFIYFCLHFPFYFYFASDACDSLPPGLVCAQFWSFIYLFKHVWTRDKALWHSQLDHIGPGAQTISKYDKHFPIRFSSICAIIQLPYIHCF